uniref:autotransporter family protein n=1 Tax=Castellaniella defragrans TaxID=75697 RepID=UPI00333E3DBB
MITAAGDLRIVAETTNPNLVGILSQRGSLINVVGNLDVTAKNGSNATGVSVREDYPKYSFGVPALYVGGNLTVESDGIGVQVINGGVLVAGTSDRPLSVSGDSIITMAQGDHQITSVGVGVLARSDIGSAIIDFADGSVSTTGDAGEGLYAFARTQDSGLKPRDAMINMSGGRVETIGVNGDGVVASSQASGGRVGVTMTGGEILTSGALAAGVIGQSPGDIRLEQTGGSITTTGGESWSMGMSSGMAALRDDASHGQATIIQAGGSIRAEGSTASGIYVYQGSGAVDIHQSAGATISANGESGKGIDVNTPESDNMILDIAGMVAGGSSADGVGISTHGAAGGQVVLDLRDGADISALSGQAIRDGAGNASVFLRDGARVRGSIVLGDGSDAMTIGPNTDLMGITSMDGGGDTAGAGGMVDTLTFVGGDHALSGASLLNWENVVVDGGRLRFTDTALVTGSGSGHGLAIANGGVVDGAAHFDLDGNMTIGAGSAFVTAGGGAGAYTVSAALNSAGVASLGDGHAGDRLTVMGGYAGQNGVVVLDTALGDDASPTDKLVAQSTSGTSGLLVRNAGGMGARTVGDGIEVVQVEGASDGVFSLAAGDYAVDGRPAIVAGAYAYQLYKGNAAGTGSGNWYLRSTLYQAGVSSYESYPQALLMLNRMSTLQQRVGNRYWSGAGAAQAGTGRARGVAPDGADTLVDGNGVWMRIENGHSRIQPRSSTSHTDFGQNTFRIQAGVDGRLAENSDGTLIGGAFFQYVQGRTWAYSRYGDGEISTEGYGIGGTLTWYGRDGFYADGQVQVTKYRSDLDATTIQRGQTHGNDGMGYALSAEVGRRLPLGPSVSITPQAQLVYSRVDFDDFRDVFGARVRMDKGDSLQGRAGIALDYETSRQGAGAHSDRRTHLYAIANLYGEFLEGSRVDVAGVRFASKADPLWGGLGVGGSYDWGGGKYSVYGEGLVGTSLKNFGDSRSASGTIGVRIRW